MAKIIGNTTATPNPRPDWLQNDENKADYIKNKPEVVVRTDIDNELNLESGNPVQNSTITQRFNELDESLKEYVDEQNSEQDENLGKLETLVTETMKATEINENSTDEQYPTAKTVYDMNQSTIEYIDSQNNTQDEEFTKLVTETIKTTTIDNSSTNDKYPTAKATYDFVKAETASMVDSAPETLDTLNELAAALGDDPNFATTVATQIGEKASKEELNTAVSTINSKIDTLTDEKNTDVETINTELNTINTNIDGINSSITEINNALDDKASKDHTHEVVTTEADGYMSTSDKEKLDNIEEGANKTIIDSELSDASTNPVENKVVNNALSNINSQIETLETQTNEKTNAINSSIEEINSKLTTTSENITTINNNITTLGGEVNTNTEEINNINTRIDNIENTGVSIVLDSEMSETSTNPVQNKVITAAIAEVQNSADSALTDSKAYTDTKIADLINSAPTTLDTLGEIATAMEENASVVEALDTAIGTKANTSDLTSHTGNKNNPHGVTLSQLGVTATAAELNTLDGITATTTELNYVDGVTSNIQTQLNNKASAGFHKTWSCATTVGSYSKLCRISGYSNFIMRIGISQNDQVSYFTLLIGTGHNVATISCLGGSGYVNNTNQIVRLTKQSATVFDVELYNTYGYNSATSVNVGCNILSPHSDINVTTYTAYTATSGTTVASCTCKPSGIVSPTFYGALSGNAGTATKLETERNIALGADFTGSANFDGSGNITINGYHYRATINGGNKANYPWHRIAYRGTKTAPITGNYSDGDAIFLIRQTYSGGGYGILKVSLRTNDSNAVAVASATWLMRSGFAADVVKIGLRNTIGAAYADLYIKVGAYPRTVISQLEGGRMWSLVNSTEANDTTTSDKKTSVECYATIETAATTLHGQAYSSIISAVDGGIINYANSAGGVAWSGISSKPSYYDAKAIKGITRNGTTFTYTCMDGTTGTFTQQDNNTTYSAATTSANGLMTAAMVTKLNGIATGANAYTHPTTSGNKHIPSGGSAGQILRWSADGTAAWGADNNTTYTLGSFGITASATELNYTKGVTSAIQTQINNARSLADTADMNATDALSSVQDLTVAYSQRLNNLKTPGLHYVSNSDGTDYPVGTNGYVLVIANADQTKVRQVFFRCGTLDSNDHQWYSRQFSSSWGKWTLLSGIESRYSGTLTSGAAKIGSIYGAASGWVIVAQVGTNKRMSSLFIPRTFLNTDATKWCFSISGDDYYLTFYFYYTGTTLYLKTNTSSDTTNNAIKYVYAIS